MKLLVEKYRTISVWLSLIVIALGFVIGSDDPRKSLCIPIAFLAGTIMYVTGGLREWMLGRRASALIHECLAVLMLVCMVLYLFQLGGIL